MNRDSRLSVALHVLLHMSQTRDAITSETLGDMMQTNPVAIRRTLGCLREANIVVAEKGHHGGWKVTRDLRSLSVGDVYHALDSSVLFGIAVRNPEATCPLERAANRVVGDALAEAETVLMTRLRSVSVGVLLENAKKRRTSRARAEGVAT